MIASSEEVDYPKCSQKTCELSAHYEYKWTGDKWMYACVLHIGHVMNVANALGLTAPSVTVRSFDLKRWEERKQENDR